MAVKILGKGKIMRIEAYISDWAFHQDLTRKEAECLTHVNYSFGHVVEGRVSIDHLQQLDRLRRVQTEFPWLKVNLSVGGWRADGFSTAVADEASREKLAQSAVAVIEKLQLTGIDWDWEYPGSDEAGIAASPEDPENMSEFLVLMRGKLDELGEKNGCYYEQSIAVGASRTGDYLWQKVLPALDTVNLMTYDMNNGKKVVHVTNLYSASDDVYSAEKSVADFVAAGVPKEKLLLGAAFYYHNFEGISLPDPFGKFYTGKGNHIDHDQLTDDWEYHWDEAAKAAYYLRDNTLLTGDDARSLTEKRRFMETGGLGGVIIWELNHDRKHLLLPYLAGKL